MIIPENFHKIIIALSACASALFIPVKTAANDATMSPEIRISNCTTESLRKIAPNGYYSGGSALHSFDATTFSSKGDIFINGADSTITILSTTRQPKTWSRATVYFNNARHEITVKFDNEKSHPDTSAQKKTRQQVRDTIKLVATCMGYKNPSP